MTSLTVTLKWIALLYLPGMTQTLRVPDPVYRRIDEESNERDIPRGIVVKEWMEDSDELARLRESEQRGGG